MPVVLPNTSRGSSTSNRLTSRTCHGSANSRIIVSSATAAERCPPPALKYTRSMDFIVGIIVRTENDRTMNLARPAFGPLHRGASMRVSRVFRHPWPLAASRLLLAAGLLPAAAEVQASGAVRAPSPPESAGGNPTHLSHGRFKDFPVYKPSSSPTG